MVPLTQYAAYKPRQNNVACAQIKGDQHDDHHYYPGGSHGFLAHRPGNLAQLNFHILQKFIGFSQHQRHPVTRFKVAGQEGFEPPTPGFGDRCSSR